MQLNEGGMVLGVLPDAVCKRGIIQLRPGDVFAAYTDGITEAMDVHGEQYCVERPVDVVLSERISPASRIVEIVLSEVERFSTGAPDGDDRVMLIVKVTHVAIAFAHLRRRGWASETTRHLELSAVRRNALVLNVQEIAHIDSRYLMNE